MKIVELFCGKKSFSNTAVKRGHQSFTIDINKQFNPDLCTDILDFNISMLPKKFSKPELIWASPPCTTFSVASISTHWKGGKNAYIPKTKESINGLKILKRTEEIIKELNPKFYFIENPRGVMRKIINLDKEPVTVTYCQYGDSRMKPTDLWSNTNWIGKRCKNGSSCHEAAPRGSKTGTQGLKNAADRSIIPKLLCLDIIKYCEMQLNQSYDEGKK